MIRECIPLLLENRNLTGEQAQETMKEIMSGRATPAQIGAFLVGLKKKGETVEEVTALARVMMEFSKRIHPKVSDFLLDTCGTGGDRLKTFNVSTTSALVVASAGVPVAKHGNRSFTSKCGSADVMERLGLNLDMGPDDVERSVEEVGIGFMYAPNFHPAMKNVAPVRRDIGVRTVFNILGPLTNPAGANAQLIGVCDLDLLELMARVALNLGARSVMTVHGIDGVDEISLTGRTAILSARAGDTIMEEIEPEDFGFKKARPEDLTGSDPEENARLTNRILSGKISEDDPRVQTVIANAAAALTLAELACDFRDGVEIGTNIIKDGAAFKTLNAMIEFSHNCNHKPA
ncbi:anthranilate phosphoribosyltransferase [Candidatus Bathyarchaeota archaeon]|nr:anthranilate phosphoribosyltransferase [Candidatus Bathyarchaeota archaeon]